MLVFALLIGGQGNPLTELNFFNVNPEKSCGRPAEEVPELGGEKVGWWWWWGGAVKLLESQLDYSNKRAERTHSSA